jgi:hypothetical protein
VSQYQDGASIPVNLRMRVVEERAATHPGDVIPVYQTAGSPPRQEGAASATVRGRTALTYG